MLHRRQFIISDREYFFHEKVETLKLEDNFYLSRCNTLPMKKLNDGNDKVWYVLGLAYNSNQCDLSLKECFYVQDVLACVKYWTGRWLLLCSNYIIPDFSANLGCYHTRQQGKYFISSSPSFCEIIPLLPHSQKTKLYYDEGIIWYPLPYTRYKDVYKLLPSQYLNIQTEECVFFNPFMNLPTLNYTTAITLIAEHLTKMARAINAHHKHVDVALTSGRDSRMIFAACVNAGIEFTTYTQYHPHMSFSDKKIPHLLAKLARVEHRFIKTFNFSLNRLIKFNRHCNRLHSGADRWLYFNDSWNEKYFYENSVLLRGGLFEMTRMHFYKRFPEPLEDKKDLGRLIYESYLGSYYHPHSPAHIFGLQKWEEWLGAHKIDDIDVRDLFYLEQDSAGWLSSNEQALDLVKMEKFHLANCSYLISLILSQDESYREGGRLQRDVVKYLHPESAKLYYNGSDQVETSLSSAIMKAKNYTIRKLNKFL